MRTRVLGSLSEIDPAQWDAVAEMNGLCCRHAFLFAVERSGINECRYRYPVIEDEKGIVACCCCCEIATELDTFARGATKAFVRLFRRFYGQAFILKTVECGCPVALGNTVSFRQGADRRESLKGLVSAVEDVASGVGVNTIVWRDFQDEDLPVLDALLGMGYSRVRNLPEARLKVRWRSFGEYLESMRSAFRCNVRAIQRRLVATGVRVEVVDDYTGLEKTFASLWKNAYDRAKEYRREILTPEFFQNMRCQVPGGVGAIVAYVNDKVSGFLLLLRDRRTLTTLFSGLDYTVSRDSGIYFGMFHKAIEVGIMEGMDEINFGLTTLEPKLALGARVVPVHIYMKSRMPLVGPVLPRLFAAMTPMPRRVVRNVFRNQL